MANIMRLGGGSGGSKPKKLLSSLTEGSLVSVLEDGKLTPFYVAKHNYEADLNGEGRTLLVRKNLHSRQKWNNSDVNAYATSAIDTWLNSEYKNLLSITVKSQMGVTQFEYTIGGGDKTVSFLSRAVFQLSVSEFGFTGSGFNVEGEALPTASLLKVGYAEGGTSAYQWTRTPRTAVATQVKIILSNGAADEYTASSDNAYARPCFTLPADMALNTEPYGDGSWGLADEDILFDTETASTTAKAGVNYTNGIADLTPAQLHEIAAAISANPNINKDTSVVYYDSGNVHRKISTGDTQNIDINGVSYEVNIIGFNHDNLSFGTVYGAPTATGKAGMSFQLVKCIERAEMMHYTATNTVGWTSCNMRVSYVPTYLGQLSVALNSVLKQVNKLTSAGNKSTTINVTQDKLFLLSEIEVRGSLGYSYAGEGEQYAYYAAGNSKLKDKEWWLRSPYSNGTTHFQYVNVNANTYFASATTNLGVAFAYCI